MSVLFDQNTFDQFDSDDLFSEEDGNEEPLLSPSNVTVIQPQLPICNDDVTLNNVKGLLEKLCESIVNNSKAIEKLKNSMKQSQQVR